MSTHEIHPHAARPACFDRHAGDWAPSVFAWVVRYIPAGWRMTTGLSLIYSPTLDLPVKSAGAGQPIPRTAGGRAPVRKRKKKCRSVTA